MGLGPESMCTDIGSEGVYMAVGPEDAYYGSRMHVMDLGPEDVYMDVGPVGAYYGSGV